jgi:hypothetical protein
MLGRMVPPKGFTPIKGIDGKRCASMCRSEDGIAVALTKWSLLFSFAQFSSRMNENSLLSVSPSKKINGAACTLRDEG